MDAAVACLTAAIETGALPLNDDHDLRLLLAALEGVLMANQPTPPRTTPNQPTPTPTHPDTTPETTPERPDTTPTETPTPPSPPRIRTA
jgi:hypothetical protein